MITFQTALYNVIYLDQEFGWELFESNIHQEPWKAMLQFDSYESEHPNWFATMRLIFKDEVVEEDLFDTSVIPYPY